jgi:hypothetical protein
MPASDWQFAARGATTESEKKCGKTANGCHVTSPTELFGRKGEGFFVFLLLHRRTVFSAVPPDIVVSRVSGGTMSPVAIRRVKAWEF